MQNSIKALMEEMAELDKKSAVIQNAMLGEASGVMGGWFIEEFVDRVIEKVLKGYFVAYDVYDPEVECGFSLDDLVGDLISATMPYSHPNHTETVTVDLFMEKWGSRIANRTNSVLGEKLD